MLVISLCIKSDEKFCVPFVSRDKTRRLLREKWNKQLRLFPYVDITNEMCGHVARMEEGRGVHKVLVGKPEGKRPLGRPRRRWKDNIKMDLHEVGGSCGGWMELAQDRDRWRALVSTVRNLRGSENVGNFLTSCRTQLVSQEGLCSVE